jgi:hypothetical protein
MGAPLLVQALLLLLALPVWQPRGVGADFLDEALRPLLEDKVGSRIGRDHSPALAARGQQGLTGAGRAPGSLSTGRWVA